MGSIDFLPYLEFYFILPSCSFLLFFVQIAAGSADKDIRVWDMATGKGLALFKGHKDEVECVDYSVVRKCYSW